MVTYSSHGSSQHSVQVAATHPLQERGGHRNTISFNVLFKSISFYIVHWLWHGLWVGKGGGEQRAAKDEKEKDWKHFELEQVRVQRKLCHYLYLWTSSSSEIKH